MTTIRLAIPGFELRAGCDLLSGRALLKVAEEEVAVLSLIGNEFFIARLISEL
ncbi:MAG TPA: hypothetical protein VNL17_11015 [Verrucomicrobiae bacterium]|nr:hypothetical protein [Verrucomicrobiae bacterium]